MWDRRALRTGNIRSRGWEAFVRVDLREEQGLTQVTRVTRPVKGVEDRETGCLPNVKDSFHSEGTGVTGAWTRP